MRLASGEQAVLGPREKLMLRGGTDIPWAEGVVTPGGAMNLTAP